MILEVADERKTPFPKAKVAADRVSELKTVISQIFSMKCNLFSAHQKSVTA